MYRTSFCCSVLLLLGGVCCSLPTATAAIMDGSLIQIARHENNKTSSDTTSGEYGNSDPTYGGALRGGEFRVTELASDGEIFKTFCLEYTENISLNTTYIATVEGGAILGGYSGATNHYDPISNATQWFYSHYRNSTLDTFAGFQYDQQNWADALQLVFWRLEGELLPSTNNTWSYLGNNTAIAQNANALWAYYTAHQTAIDEFEDSRVQALNLWTTNVDNWGKPLYDSTKYASLETDAALRASLAPYKAQSQLYYAPPPFEPGGSPVVPEPASIVTWASLACLGFVTARRRKILPSAA